MGESDRDLQADWFNALLLVAPEVDRALLRSAARLLAEGDGPGPPPVVVRALPYASKEERARRGQILRLEPEAWKQLKVLAIDQEKTSHDLLIEAVNLLFNHYNRPTIAG